MDFRSNYNTMKKEINNASFPFLDNDCQFVKDIKQQMILHIDVIIDLEKEKKAIDKKINEEKKSLKRMAENWGI